MKLTGMDGVLRIMDSAAVIHNAAPLSYTIDVVKFDGAVTYANITTDVEADDAAAASAFLADNNDVVYIGSTNKFAMIQYLKGAGTNYAAASGALKAYYFNGTNFDTALEGVVDGTAVSADCFTQDGYIGFHIPHDWAIGADALLADLDADKYYVALMTTTSSTTDPDADVLAPVDGQYFEVAFSAMDFSGPIGRAKPEEILVLDRKRMSARGHYIEGSDDPVYAPLPISWSCMIDDTYNKDDIFLALACDDPDSTYWTATGTTSKGSTKNDGSNANPAFADTTKKAVNIQMLFNGSTTSQGWAYYEVFFPAENQRMTESEEGVMLSCQGACYGVIERIHGFGNRY